MTSYYYTKSMTTCNQGKCSTASMHCKDGKCKLKHRRGVASKTPKCAEAAIPNSTLRLTPNPLRNKTLTKSNVHVVSLKGCKWCKKLEELLKREKIPFTVHDTVPRIFVKGTHIGGYNNTLRLLS